MYKFINYAVLLPSYHPVILYNWAFEQENSFLDKYIYAKLI